MTRLILMSRCEYEQYSVSFRTPTRSGLGTNLALRASTRAALVAGQGKCHLRDFFLARHPICASSIWATFYLRDISIARPPSCATFQLRDTHLRDIPVARHPSCATFQLRDISFARHPSCATTHLRDFFPSCLGPLLVSLG